MLIFSFSISQYWPSISISTSTNHATTLWDLNIFDFELNCPTGKQLTNLESSLNGDSYQRKMRQNDLIKIFEFKDKHWGGFFALIGILSCHLGPKVSPKAPRIQTLDDNLKNCRQKSSKTWPQSHGNHKKFKKCNSRKKIAGKTLFCSSSFLLIFSFWRKCCF